MMKEDGNVLFDEAVNRFMATYHLGPDNDRGNPLPTHHELIFLITGSPRVTNEFRSYVCL